MTGMHAVVTVRVLDPAHRVDRSVSSNLPSSV